MPHYQNQRHRYMQNTGASAGNALVPQAATAARYSLEPYTPVRTAAASPADYVKTFVAPSNASQTAGEMRNVKARWNLKTTYAALAARPDGGKALTLDSKSGVFTPKTVVHSHRSDANSPAEKTGVDFPVHAELTLDHNTEVPLLVETPIRALKSEISQVYPGSQTAENPNGNIALHIPAGGGTATFDRTLEDRLKSYMETFAGHDPKDADKYVTRIGSSGNTAVMETKVATPVAYFYNKRMTDPAKKVGPEHHNDEFGGAPVEHDVAELAKQDWRTAHTAEVNYSNLTDIDAFTVKIGRPDELIMDHSGKARETSVRLSDAFKNTPGYTAARNTANLKSNAPAFLAASEKAVKDNFEVKFTGALKIDYYHVDQNFQFKPNNK